MASSGGSGGGGDGLSSNATAFVPGGGDGGSNTIVNVAFLVGATNLDMVKGIMHGFYCRDIAINNDKLYDKLEIINEGHRVLNDGRFDKFIELAGQEGWKVFEENGGLEGGGKIIRLNVGAKYS